MTDQGAPTSPTPSDAAPPAAAVSAPTLAPNIVAALEMRLRRLRRLTAAAIAVSVVSLVAAVTAPLWQGKVFGQGYAPHLLVLAAAQLRPALSGGQPFSLELSALRTVELGDTPLGRQLQEIADYAEKGVPTVAQLNTRFGRLANEVTVGGGGLDPNPTWVEKTAAVLYYGIELNSLAHRLYDPRETTAILWDARVHLDAGDLPGAIAVLERLTDRPAVLARPWLVDAKARVAVDRVLMQLDTLSAELSGRNPVRVSLAD